MRKAETLKQWLKKKPGNFTSKFGCPDKCLVVHWEIESHGVGACLPLSSKCAPGIFFCGILGLFYFIFTI